MLKKFTILTLLLCFTICGCNTVNRGTASKQDNNKDNNLKTLVTNETIEKQNFLVEKQNSYIELNNYVVDEFFNRILNPYIDMFGLDEFVKPEQAPFINMVIKSEIQTIKTALEYSKKEPKIENFDEIVEDFATDLLSLIDLTNEASAYYRQKNYVDDDFAKGKEYHNKIIDIIANEFFDSYEKFTEASEAENERKRKEDMKELKDNDMLIKYEILNVLYIAGDIQSELIAQDISAVNIIELNLEPIQEKYESLINAIKNLKEYSKQQSRLDKENINKQITEQYISSAGEMKATVTELIQRVKTKEEIDAFDIEHGYVDSVDGSPEKFYKALNNLIDYYNMAMTN